VGSEQNVRSGAASIGDDVVSMAQPSTQSLFEELGGETKVREIIDTFIDHVFEDRMIGFFFRNANRARIKQMEYQLIAKFLGAGIEYQGKPLDQAHARHPIMGGHFARRRQILKETLESYRVPESIKEAWLGHTDSLKPLITAQKDSDCDPVEARQRMGSN